jgi:hypothetical protein
MRSLLTSLHVLQVDWKVNKGPDRTRENPLPSRFIRGFAQAEAFTRNFSTQLPLSTGSIHGLGTLKVLLCRQGYESSHLRSSGLCFGR